MKSIRDPILPNIPESASIEEINRWREDITHVLQDLHQNVYDDLNAEVSRSRVHGAASQVIPPSTHTIVQYNIEDFDVLGEHDNVSPFRFTAKETGFYQINASLLSAPVVWANNVCWYISLWRDGAHISNGSTFVGSGISQYAGSEISDLIYLTVGQYIDIRVYHIHSTNVSVVSNVKHNYFSIHRLS